MKTAYIFLTTGFEEIEALATIDLLRRGGVDLASVSLEDSIKVKGGHGVEVAADLLFADVNFDTAQMLILPGGTVRIDAHEGLKAKILVHLASGRRVAAICAAPMVLGGLGLLQGKKATCYPGFEGYLKGATLCTEQAVVTDGLITTGKGPGLTFAFALELLKLLKGEEAAQTVAGQILI